MLAAACCVRPAACCLLLAVAFLLKLLVEASAGSKPQAKQAARREQQAAARYRRTTQDVLRTGVPACTGQRHAAVSARRTSQAVTGGIKNLAAGATQPNKTKYEPAKPQKTIVFFSLLAFTLCSREASLARSIVIIIRFSSPELGRPEGRPSRLLLGGTHLGIPKKPPKPFPIELQSPPRQDEREFLARLQGCVVGGGS